MAQPPKHSAHGGLRQVQPVRRPGDISLRQKDVERDQQIQIHLFDIPACHIKHSDYALDDIRCRPYNSNHQKHKGELLWKHVNLNKPSSSPAPGAASATPSPSNLSSKALTFCWSDALTRS